MQQQCLSVDVSLKTAACMALLMPGVLRPWWPGRAVPRHCICSSRVVVWAMPGKAACPRPPSVLAASEMSPKVTVLASSRNKSTFPVVFPVWLLGVIWSSSPSLLTCYRQLTFIIPSTHPKQRNALPAPPYNCTVGSVLRSSMTVVRQTNRLLAVFPAETIWAII